MNAIQERLSKSVGPYLHLCDSLWREGTDRVNGGSVIEPGGGYDSGRFAPAWPFKTCIHAFAFKRGRTNLLQTSLLQTY